MTYYLPEATQMAAYLNFSVFFLQLICSLLLMARQFYYVTTDLTVKLNYKYGTRKQSTDPAF